MTGGNDSTRHGRLATETNRLLRSLPITIPGAALRQADAVWVHLDPQTTDRDDRFSLVITLFPVREDAGALAGAWVVLAAEGGPESEAIRRERVDGGGQCRFHGLTAGSWRALLLGPSDPEDGGARRGQRPYPQPGRQEDLEEGDSVEDSEDPEADWEPALWEEAWGTSQIALQGETLDVPKGATRTRLLRLAQAENPIVVTVAVDALGRLRVMEAVPILVGLLRHQEMVVRRSAADALGEIGEPSALDELLRMLDEDLPFVQRAAAEALGQIGDRRAALALIRVLFDRDREHAVLEAAAEALGEVEDPGRDPRAAAALRYAGFTLELAGQQPAFTAAELTGDLEADPGQADPASPEGITEPAMSPPAPVRSTARALERGDVSRFAAGSSRDRVSDLYRPPSHVVMAAAEQALAGLGAFDVASGVFALRPPVRVFVHPHPCSAEWEEIVIGFQPRRVFAGVRVALRGQGPVPRLHPGELDSRGEILLRGVPGELYELRLRAARDAPPELRPVSTEVAARGAAPVETEPRGTEVEVLCDSEGRSVTIRRDRPGAFTAEVTGLGITDRETIVELPIRSGRHGRSAHRLLAPLRWDHRTGRCAAHLRLDSGDHIEEGEGPRAVGPAWLTPAMADAVRVSAARAADLTVDAWETVATRTATDPAISAAIRQAHSERNR